MNTVQHFPTSHNESQPVTAISSDLPRLPTKYSKRHPKPRQGGRVWRKTPPHDCPCQDIHSDSPRTEPSLVMQARHGHDPDLPAPPPRPLIFSLHRRADARECGGPGVTPRRGAGAAPPAMGVKGGFPLPPLPTQGHAVTRSRLWFFKTCRPTMYSYSLWLKGYRFFSFWSRPVNISLFILVNTYDKREFFI